MQAMGILVVNRLLRRKGCSGAMDCGKSVGGGGQDGSTSLEHAAQGWDATADAQAVWLPALTWPPLPLPFLWLPAKAHLDGGGVVAQHAVHAQQAHQREVAQHAPHVGLQQWGRREVGRGEAG